MSPFANPLEAQRQIEAQLGVLREYQGTEMHVHLLRLLDALIGMQVAALVEVGADRLQHLQGAVQQLAALRASLASTGAPALPIV